MFAPTLRSSSGGAFCLRHDQIGCAIAIHIRCNQSARRVQLNAVQSQRVAHIFKAAIAAIAKDAHLRAAFVSTIAARSIQPSLSMSIGVTPHPRSAPFSGSCNALEAPAHLVRALRHCATA